MTHRGELGLTGWGLLPHRVSPGSLPPWHPQSLHPFAPREQGNPSTCVLAAGKVWGESPRWVRIWVHGKPSRALSHPCLALVAWHRATSLVPLSWLLLRQRYRSETTSIAAMKTSFCLYSNSETWWYPSWGCLACVPCPCLILSPVFSPSNPAPSVPLQAVLGARRQIGGFSPLCCTPGLDLSGLAQQQGGHSSRRERTISLGFGLSICTDAVCLPALDSAREEEHGCSMPVPKALQPEGFLPAQMLSCGCGAAKSQMVKTPPGFPRNVSAFPESSDPQIKTCKAQCEAQGGVVLPKPGHISIPEQALSAARQLWASSDFHFV